MDKDLPFERMPSFRIFRQRLHFHSVLYMHNSILNESGVLVVFLCTEKEWLSMNKEAQKGWKNEKRTWSKFFPMEYSSFTSGTRAL